MRLILAGAVRNCARYLPQIFTEIDTNSSLFDDFKYVFVESDSDDASADLLTKFHQTHPAGDVQLLGRLGDELPLRTDRIARARQRCLELALGQGWRTPNDYFVMVDCDDAGAAFSLAAIRSTISQATFEWDALFANTSGREYYDIFALRHPMWCPSDCWQEVRDRPSFMSEEDAQNLFVHARQIWVSQQAKPILVESAFGGLAIYRLPALADASYLSQIKHAHEFCEHVVLHCGMRARGFDKLYIYPPLALAQAKKRKTTWSERCQRFARKLYAPAHRLSPSK